MVGGFERKPRVRIARYTSPITTQVPPMMNASGGRLVHSQIVSAKPIAGATMNLRKA